MFEHELKLDYSPHITLTLYLRCVDNMNSFIPGLREKEGGSRKKQKVDEDHPLASRWKVQFTLLKALTGEIGNLARRTTARYRACLHS